MELASEELLTRYVMLKSNEITVKLAAGDDLLDIHKATKNETIFNESPTE